MSYPVALASVTFDVPSLPWRAAKAIRPALVAWVDAHDFGRDGAGFVRLKESELDALADLVFEAVKHAPQAKLLDRAAFDDMAITPEELVLATTPILQACGLKFGKPGEGADPKA